MKLRSTDSKHPWRIAVAFSLSLLGVVATQMPVIAQGESASAPVPLTLLTWSLLASAISLLMPIGFILIGVAGLDRERAWGAALSAVAAMGLAALAYWAVGFALHFGGVGLLYMRPELRMLVWEWTPLPPDWGIGWGVAGLSGWFLAGREVTSLVYALFLSQAPWLFTAALLPVMALRGRAPALATMIIALTIGGFVYPLAGNWVHGGGWLAALGHNLTLGHGFIDVGGGGVVHLLAASFGLVALIVWVPRRKLLNASQLPADYQPLLTVVGSLFVLAGAVGWLWSNPLHVEAVGEVGMMRGSVNILLSTTAGAIVPLLYTWFVAGDSHPTLAARGLVAGAVAGLAAAPFMQPMPALLIGLLAGATTPFLTYAIDYLARLDDATGLITTAGVPAITGLVLAGIFADGVSGVGWQATGIDVHLGVAGQGVSGLFVASGFQPDFPGQLQAQLIGIAALLVWGIATGALICVPLGLLFWGLHHSEQREEQPGATLQEVARRPAPEAEPSLPERRRTFPSFPSEP